MQNNMEKMTKMSDFCVNKDEHNHIGYYILQHSFMRVQESKEAAILIYFVLLPWFIYNI